jgi:hypothetical protein
MVTLQTFNNRIEAEELRMFLEGSGIPAEVLSDDAGGANPVLASVFGVRVLVDEGDAAKAHSLIDSITANQQPAKYVPLESPYPKLFRTIKLMWSVVFAYLIVAFVSKLIFDHPLGDRALIIFIFQLCGAFFLTFIYAMLKIRQRRDSSF